MSQSPTSSAASSPPLDGAPGVRRVAMVIQRFRPAFSGQAIQVEQLARGLAERGVHTTVVTAVRGEPGSIEDCDGYAVRRVRVDLLPGSRDRIGLWAPTFGALVAPALWRSRPDVVHVHGPTDGLLGAWAYCRLAGRPAIAEMTLLGDDDPVTLRDRRVRAARLRWAVYRRYDAWVAMSDAFLASSRSAGLPMDRVRVIPQAVDTTRFRPADAADRRRLRAATGLPVDVPLVAFVGTLGKRKGVDLLLDAWSSIRARHSTALLVLVGGPPAGDAADLALERRLERPPEGMVATGFRDDPETLLRAADVFVFPSRREGFGSVIIEAMACALPCVVAELPGITDRVLGGDGQGGAGVVVPQESARAIGDAVADLLDDPERRARLGELALQRARERYALEVVVDRYLQLYGELAEGRS